MYMYDFMDDILFSVSLITYISYLLIILRLCQLYDAALAHATVILHGALTGEKIRYR